MTSLDDDNNIFLNGSHTLSICLPENPDDIPKLRLDPARNGSTESFWSTN